MIVSKNAEHTYQVSRYVLGALLLVESGCGEITGSEQIFYRLARLVSTADPDNVKWNAFSKSKITPRASVEDYAKRAQYLEDTFLPELLALYELRKRGVDILTLRGSGAGAFGIPQFLPSSYLRFGIDADKDGQVSLNSMPDATASAAHFLHAAGWKDGAALPARKQALWSYNRSSAYGEAILKVSILLKEAQRRQHKPQVKRSRR